MPLTICAIGSSHLSSGKKGWNTIHERHPDVEIVFFAAPGDMIVNINVEGDRLVPATDELREKIALTSQGKTDIAGDYDRYLIWGLPLGFMAAAKAYIGGMDSGAKDEAIVAAIREKLHQCKSVELFKKVRAITKAPIGIVPTPLRSQKAPLDPLPRALTSADLDRLSTLYERSVRQVAKEMGFVPFFQPEATRVDGLRTKSIYSADRMTTRGDGEDITHMNAEFGALVLEDVLANREFVGDNG